MKDILLITPPFTQLNTPYPATAYLKGFLNTKGYDSFQMDLGIEVILELFQKDRIQDIFEQVGSQIDSLSDNALRIYALRHRYITIIDEVVQFLQGNHQTLARNICSEAYLPRASRFDHLDDLTWSFGMMGHQDKAKHLSTLFLEDLSDLIIECIDDQFGFSRYAERLGRCANEFDELYDHLHDEPSYIDGISVSILEKRITELNPKLICFSVPFPGNLYSAFRCALFIKENHPNIKIAMGGGFANTELRSLSDPRVFEFFDYISLDDGELPIEMICQEVLTQNQEKEDKPRLLKRTYVLESDTVDYNNTAIKQDYKQADVGTPDYSDLLLDRYISVIELTNPMHSLWSDGRWNKLTMAHGCYWGKCTFCDISLDYIKLYEPIAAKLLVDRMQSLIEQTNERGFHFVDEAAPPSLMKELAIEILKRELNVTWWTNIRFEKSFSYDLCLLLKKSGCIAVSGGLEVASDRLLKLIKKGVTVAQVAEVTDNFTESGIMVHAYLMYGYPTQTVQETIDSLEMVRQLFENEVMQSGFWHQFALTAHSPVGLNPADYGIIPKQNEIKFANNDIDFEDSTGIDHNQFSDGLKTSLFNYMQGVGLDFPLQDWFDFEIPETSIDNEYIERCLFYQAEKPLNLNAKLIWLESIPLLLKAENEANLLLLFHHNTNSIEIELTVDLAHWFLDILENTHVLSPSKMLMKTCVESYEERFEDFDEFWNSEAILNIRYIGLVAV